MTAILMALFMGYCALLGAVPATLGADATHEMRPRPTSPSQHRLAIGQRHTLLLRCIFGIETIASPPNCAAPLCLSQR